MTRAQARQKLDETLERPLDPEEAAQHDRAMWGLTPEAIAASEAMERMLGM